MWEESSPSDGQSGTISTVHANSAAQGISRFTTCVLQSGVEIPYSAIKSNIANSLNIIIQIERRPGVRFVSQVLEICGYNDLKQNYDINVVQSESIGAACGTKSAIGQNSS
jgi:Flp pilus assembly CpaF family ATPase